MDERKEALRAEVSCLKLVDSRAGILLSSAKRHTHILI